MRHAIEVFSLAPSDLKDCFTILGPGGVRLPAVHRDHAAWVCDCMNLAYGVGLAEGIKGSEELAISARKASNVLTTLKDFIDAKEERANYSLSHEIACYRELLEKWRIFEGLKEGAA